MENFEYYALTAFVHSETEKRIESMSLRELGPYVGTFIGRHRLINLLTVPDRNSVLVSYDPERLNVSVEGLAASSARAIGRLVQELRVLNLPVWLKDTDVPEGLLVSTHLADDTVRMWIHRIRGDQE